MNWIEAIEALLEPDHTTTDLHRGHSTVHFVWEGSFDEDPEGTEEGIYDHETPSFFLDGTRVEGNERPCERCGLVAEDGDAPDPCLGMIDGVKAACCGHNTEPSDCAFGYTPDGKFTYVGEPYVWIEGQDDALRGEEALAYFVEQGVGPPKEES
jgi:hypothetical protein